MVIKEHRQVTYVIDQYIIEHGKHLLSVERHHKPDGKVLYEVSDHMGPWVKGTEVHDEVVAFLKDR